VTTLTPEQFAIVTRELGAMLADGDLDEAWRVMKMFADGRFNYRPTDFPQSILEAVTDKQPRRRYATLLGEIGTIAGSTFDIVEIGSLTHDARTYPLVKLVTKPSPSPYATLLPICMVAGVHGDEADGVLSALEFARRFAKSPELTASYSLTVYPCINPTGYERMTRENATGKDLNREFFRDSAEQEVRIMERELKGQEFVGFINGHSDYESFGLYAYATGAVLSERLARPALFQASSVIPINTDPIIDGHPAQSGIINQTIPGSLGPLSKGATEPFDITIETPNLFALRKRVEAQAIAFETILQEYRAVAAEAMYL
jgi:hypothetical protein